MIKFEFKEALDNIKRYFSSPILIVVGRDDSPTATLTNVITKMAEIMFLGSLIESFRFIFDYFNKFSLLI